jgi:signal peptidase I
MWGRAFMTLAPDETVRFPWLSVWFSPRQTIERLVAGPPSHLVWLLVILGTIAGICQQLALARLVGLLHDWTFLLGLVLLGAVTGVVSLYLYAIILGWIGNWFGGQATRPQIRTAFAWSMLPIIAGGIVVLIVGITTDRSAMTSGTETVLSLIFSAWSLIVFLLMLGRVERFGFWPTICTYLIAAGFLGFGAAFFIRSFLYQPFDVPSSSMRPTLVVGDYFFVSKFAYGISRFSLPFSPTLFSGRILSSQPEPGDVVVFRHPRDTATDFVKRVAGLPGDRIQMKQGQLYINDAPVKHERLADIPDDGACGSAAGTSIKHWRETLPNGRSYETLDCFDGSPVDKTLAFTVADGHFFVLGDNRDNSSDSRSFGSVPFENLIGRVSLIFFSYNKDGAAHIRTDRIGKVVR